jgi:WD40 repeat protein
MARLGTTRLRHGADVTFVSFGPDGQTLVTAAQDNTIRLWDLTSGKEIRRFGRHKPGVLKGAGNLQLEEALGLMAQRNDGLSVALTRDGKTLAVASGNLVQLTNVATGQELREIQGPSSGLAGLLFSPDGRTLAGRATNGAVFVWATDTGKELHQLKPAKRPASNEIVLTIGGAADGPGMAFTANGKILAAASTDYEKQKAIHSVKFWDMASGKEIRKLKAPDRVSAVAIAQGGKILAYGAGDNVYLSDAEEGKEIHRLKVADGGIVALALSPDEKTLVVRGKNQRMRVWDTNSGKELQQLSAAEPAERVGGLAGGLMFLNSGFAAPEARVLAISTDGKKVAAASGHSVRVWAVATGKEVALLAGHRRPPSAITVSSDGASVVSWGPDRLIYRWETTGKPPTTFPAPPRTTLAALAADGRMIALANADNTIRLHDTATGEELRQIKEHAKGTAALAFAPHGKVLAWRGADNVVRLYDVAKGTELREFALRPGSNPGRRDGVIVIGGPVEVHTRHGSGPGILCRWQAAGSSGPWQRDTQHCRCLLRRDHGQGNSPA